MLREVVLILGGSGKCCLGGSRPYLQLCTSHIYWHRSTGAVSYTHLDVYKRQVLCFSTHETMNCRFVSFPFS